MTKRTKTASSAVIEQKPINAPIDSQALDVSKETSVAENLLSQVITIPDIEKRYPGILEFYKSHKKAQNKLRNKRKKDRKKIRDQAILKNLDVKSEDFTPKLVKYYSLKASDLVAKLHSFEGLSGAKLEAINNLNRSIVEQSVAARTNKFLQLDQNFFESKDSEESNSSVKPISGSAIVDES